MTGCGLGLRFPFFFFLFFPFFFPPCWKREEETESIKMYKLFLAAASEDKIGFSNDFPALPATPCKKVPGAIGAGTVEKNKHLAKEEQSSGKGRGAGGGGGRKSKGN